MLDLEIEQILAEEHYSKKHLVSFLKEKSEKINKYKVKYVKLLNKYIHDNYWSSKEDYITAMCMSDVSVNDIADELIMMLMLHRESSIQNVANDIGNLFSHYIDDTFVRIQIGSDILDVCEDNGYELIRTEDSLMFISAISLKPETKLRLSQFMYQPPLVAKPLNITNNSQSGYHTFNESIILGGVVKHHNKPVRLDVINTLNSIKFVIDNDVLTTEVEKPKEILVGQDEENYKQYLIEKKEIANIYKDKAFFFNHKVDSRGRIYSSGYHLNYQSHEYNKALLSLEKAEVCTQ